MWWCQAEHSASQTHDWNVEPLYSEIVLGVTHPGRATEPSSNPSDSESSETQESESNDVESNAQSIIAGPKTRETSYPPSDATSSLSRPAVIPLPDVAEQESGNRSLKDQVEATGSPKKCELCAESKEKTLQLACDSLINEKVGLTREVERLNALVDDLEDQIIQQQHEVTDLQRSLAGEKERVLQKNEQIERCEARLVEAKEQSVRLETGLSQKIEVAAKERAEAEAELRATYSKKIRALRYQAGEFRSRSLLTEKALRIQVSELGQREQVVDTERRLHEATRIADDAEKQELERQVDQLGIELAKQARGFERRLASQEQKHEVEMASEREHARAASQLQAESHRQKVRVLRGQIQHAHDSLYAVEQSRLVILIELAEKDAIAESANLKCAALSKASSRLADDLEAMCQNLQRQKVADWESRLAVEAKAATVATDLQEVTKLLHKQETEYETAKQDWSKRQAVLASQFEQATAYITQLELRLKSAENESLAERNEWERHFDKRTKSSLGKIRTLRGQTASYKQLYESCRQAFQNEITRSATAEEVCVDLREKNRQLQHELEATQVALENQSADSKQLQEQLLLCCRVLEAWCLCFKSFEDVTKQVTDTETQLFQELAYQSNESEQLKVELQQSKANLADAEIVKHELREQLSVSTALNKQLERDKLDLTNLLKSLEQSHARKQTELARHVARLKNNAELMARSNENAIALMEDRHWQELDSLRFVHAQNLASKKRASEQLGTQLSALKGSLSKQTRDADSKLAELSSKHAASIQHIRTSYGSLLADLEDSLAEQSKRWRVLLRERNVVEQRLLENEARLKEATLQLSSTQADLNRTKSEAFVSQKLIEELRSRVASLEEENTQNQATVEKLEQQEKQLLKSVGEARLEAEKSASDFSMTRQKLDATAARMEELERKENRSLELRVAAEQQVQELLDCEKENNRQLALLEFQNESLRKKLINQVGARRRAELAIRMAALDCETGSSARAAISEINQQTKIERLQKEIKATRNLVERYRKRAAQAKERKQADDEIRNREQDNSEQERQKATEQQAIEQQSSQ